jgi:hypothetical protein
MNRMNVSLQQSSYSNYDCEDYHYTLHMFWLGE